MPATSPLGGVSSPGGEGWIGFGGSGAGSGVGSGVGVAVGLGVGEAVDVGVGVGGVGVGVGVGVGGQGAGRQPLNAWLFADPPPSRFWAMMIPLSCVFPGKTSSAPGASSVPCQARFAPICMFFTSGKFHSRPRRSCSRFGFDSGSLSCT